MQKPIAKVRSNSRQKHFSASVGCFFTSIPSFSPAFMFFFSYQPHSFKAIQEAFGVQDVVSSHDAGTTIFSAPEKVDEDKVRQVIKDAGYEVTGITQE